jgi:hypothetical protein
MLTMLNVNNNLFPFLLICHLQMLTYEIHPVLYDDIHYINTHILYMIILQNSPSIIVMNLYLLSIQKSLFIIVTMLTHYKR